MPTNVSTELLGGAKLTKTKDRYVREILLLHETLSHWNPTAACVIKDVFKLKSVPDKYQVLSMLRIRKDAWYKKLDIVIWVASNEQKGWTDEELGFPTAPMPLLPELKKVDKSFTGQTGDYVCVVEGQIMRFGIERKAMEDFYSSLMGRNEDKSRKVDRLYREFNRAKQVFDCFYMLVECTEDEYLAYKPLRHKMKTESLDEFNKRNEHPGASIESRRAVVKSIQAKDVHVVYHECRQSACDSVGEILRQWVLINFVDIINGGIANVEQ